MSNENSIRRESVKALRKATNALRRRVEREKKRQEAIVQLHKDSLQLGKELQNLRQKETQLFSQAIDELRNSPYQDDGRYPV